MKKISCVGYHATGSGAVDDFLREFSNIETAKYGIESRFLQDPDGISDLEFNLIENPHRLNSGFALKRFLRFAKAEERTYRHIFGDKWMKWAQSYIEALSDFSYKGYWHGDIRIIPQLQLFVYKARRAINLLLPAKFKKNKYFSYLPNVETYCVSVSEMDFLRITQEKCEEVCTFLNESGKEYVVLDQVVSPQNIARYLRYISDLKVIVVDRDPRDVYLNDIVINHDFVLPQNVHEFCEVYRMSRVRKLGTDDPSLVLRINFEDMIYRYDKTTERIMDFLGLKEQDHENKRKYFNPSVSKENTQIWKQNTAYAEIAIQIEKELPEFLYQY